ncbi:urease accessory protein UreD [Pararhodospirillum photometricum]|uniref:urease accessory protein UreD n=1 Tax=Pararhodospirillum photometricum TaxID=1084 RepID=UPI001F58B5FD|nr:urease accessory protein UreD [Pararhodospirillum photometricum]
MRVLFPDPPTGEPPLAALVTTSGGLTGGDRLDLRATVTEGAAQIVASAAEKIYRSTGADVRVSVDLAVREGGWLEFLPQETIVFDGARLRRQTVLDVEAGASALAGEILIFGRTARGERFTQGLVRDAWEVRRDGRLVWTEALHVDDPAVLLHPAGFNGAVAAATLVLVAPDPGEALAWARASLAGYGGRAGATVVNSLLVARWLDDDAARLRASFGRLWADLRHRLHGLAACLPRLWDI